MENTNTSSVAESKEDSFELAITKTTICMAVLAVSLIENIFVLVVLKKDFGNRLRTANSYFIANMSVADALFALQNLPLSYNNIVLNGHWVTQGSFGMVLCKIDMFFSLISMVTANLTILAIAVNRFFAVYLPFKKIITRRVCFCIIFITWFISTSFASPMLYYADLSRVTEDLTVCTLTDTDVLKIWYMVLTGILATTLLAMLVLYTAIGLKLKRQTFPGNPNQRVLTRRQRRDRDVYKMLVTLIIAFYVCSLPVLMLQLSRVLEFYNAFKKGHGRFIAVVMLFMNGVINPLIYFIFNESFRDGVKVALAKCRCCRRALYSVGRQMDASRRSAGSRIDRRTSSQL